MRSSFLFLIIFLPAALPMRAQNGQAAEVVPREMGVLLLPALDATRDSTNMLAPRQSVIRHREEFEFITRQFKMSGESLAVKAADDIPKIELGDLAARTGANLDLLARRAGTDWAVSVVVEEARGDFSAAGEFRARTRVLLQVRNARQHDWLVNAEYTGEAASASPVFAFKNSLDAAVKDSLENFLGIYPRTVFVSDENSLKDYLAGQTKPFVGNPKVSFAGLKAER